MRMTLEAYPSLWAARLRQRAAMCVEFSRGATGTGLAAKLAELAEELAADAERLDPQAARRDAGR